jgi:hypothetical protein
MACKLPSVAGTCRVRADAGKLRSAVRSANSETRKAQQMRMDRASQEVPCLQPRGGGHRTARGEEHRSLDETKQSRQVSFTVVVESFNPQISVIINAHARGGHLAKRCIPSPVVV